MTRARWRGQKEGTGPNRPFLLQRPNRKMLALYKNTAHSSLSHPFALSHKKYRLFSSPTFSTRFLFGSFFVALSKDLRFAPFLSVTLWNQTLE
ncbi:hypothetical protein QQP08_015524 [Theobroma cacao]|nr:hypothetical protein QQP08_015524 [Theobroma cacao]